MSTNKPHQLRAFALLQIIQCETPPETQVPIPESTLLIDMCMELGGINQAWGFLAENLTNRTLIIEHSSRPPLPSMLAGAMTKLHWASSRWLHSRDKGLPHNRKPPLLLCLSVGRPCGALQDFTLFEESERHGVWIHPPCTALEAILIDVKGLEWSPDCAYFKLFDHKNAPENRKKLFDSLEVGILIKKRLHEVTMKESHAFSSEERDLSYEAVIERGRQEGLEQGLEQGLERGLEQGRLALLRTAQNLLQSCELEELELIEDLHELEARLLELLKNRSSLS